MIKGCGIGTDKYLSRCVPIPYFFDQVEVFQGFWAEMGLMLTYLVIYWTDLEHWLWVIFLTEWATKVAANVLGEAYDTYCLWYLPLALRAYIRSLDLSVPLCAGRTNQEVHLLVDIVDDIN